MPIIVKFAAIYRELILGAVQGSKNVFLQTADAGAECNRVIELKPGHHAA
jgi:hypothetical protein